MAQQRNTQNRRYSWLVPLLLLLSGGLVLGLSTNLAKLAGDIGPGQRRRVNFIFFSAIPHVGASFVALIITLPPLLTYVGALL